MNKFQFRFFCTAFFVLIFTSLIMQAGEINYNNFYELDDEEAEDATLAIYSNLGKNVPLQGNLSQLSYFFKALKNSGNQKIRIAHYGDSLIWGDVITQDIRAIFQERFGGRGAGFLALGNDDVRVRHSILHKFSDDIEWTSVFTKNSKRYPLSINGIVSVPQNRSWVTYRAGMAFPASKDFNEFRLFYSNANSGAGITISAGSETFNLALEEGNGAVKELYQKFENEKDYLKVDFHNTKDAYVYGICLENGNGVYVDNFAMRGNSGASLQDIEASVVKSLQSKLNYKLLLINFGINVVEAGKKNYTWYEKKMVKVINDLKKLFPETSIVLISSGDRSIKKGSRLTTDEGIPYLIRTQQKIANETRVAFWNLFEAMGGKDSMVKWVNDGLANKDYVHFNKNGGRIIAELFVDALLKNLN